MSIATEIWSALLELAKEQDIDRGGYADARTSAINFWCGPAQKPENWKDSWPIIQGGLNYPRAFVGTVRYQDGEWQTTSVNYVAKREENLTYDEVTNRPEDLAWVRQEFAKLWQACVPGVPLPALQVRR